jgi:uncharacterized repeat protein (TIGR03803 family)
MVTLFAASPFVAGTGASAQTETVLHTFVSTSPYSNLGYTPLAGLLLDASGNLYGTTSGGGPNTNCVYGSGCGTAFELIHKAGGGWTEKTLHSFGSGKDGAFPGAALIFDAAGNLYGTTEGGGSNPNCTNGATGGCGTVFELLPSANGWTERILHNFNNDGKDGFTPQSKLIFDAAGNLYGTTYQGGAFNNGVVFALTPKAGGGWSEKILHHFDTSGGYFAQGGVVLDSAGNVFGTTEWGGAYNNGTVYELSRNAGGTWTEKVLYSFNDNGTYQVPSPLVFDSAGNLFGALGGFDCYCGSLFELTPAGGGGWTEKTAYTFIGPGPSSLTFDSAGNLYGTIWKGGNWSNGAVFKLTSVSGGWVETESYSFTGNNDGSGPNPGLVLDAGGTLYGTTVAGGRGLAGTVFEIVP